MDFVGILPTTKKEHAYLFIMFESYNKMCVLMSYRKNISGQEAT